jgi:hypothetical protein
MESMSLQNGENLLLVHRKCRILVSTFLTYYMLFHLDIFSVSREAPSPHSVLR